MTEKTNQDLYDKMIEAFNMVFDETQRIKNTTVDIKDKVDPLHSNVLDIYGFVQQLLSRIDKLNDRITALENSVRGLPR